MMNSETFTAISSKSNSNSIERINMDLKANKGKPKTDVKSTKSKQSVGIKRAKSGSVRKVAVLKAERVCKGALVVAEVASLFDTITDAEIKQVLSTYRKKRSQYEKIYKW